MACPRTRWSRPAVSALRDGYPATAGEVTRLAYEMVQRRFDPHEYRRDPDEPRSALAHVCFLRYSE